MKASNTRTPHAQSRKRKNTYNPLEAESELRSISAGQNVTVQKPETGAKRDTDAELLAAAELLNRETALRRDPLVYSLDIVDAGRDDEAYLHTLHRVSGVLEQGIGRLMALLNPDALYTKASQEVAEERRKLAEKWAELFGAVAATFRDDWSRLRVCAVCSRLFLPRRQDQKGCSRSCAGLIRVRRHREKQAQYEYNRKLKSAGLKPAREKKR